MCKLVDTRKHLFIVVDSGAIIQHIARRLKGAGLVAKDWIMEYFLIPLHYFRNNPDSCNM